MPRTALRFLLGTILTLVVYGFANDRPAMALTIVHSPFGNAPVNVFIGACTTAPCQIILWSSGGVCKTTTIGNGSGLIDDFEVTSGSGNDLFEITFGSVLCGPSYVSLGTLLYNGHYLDYFAGAGNDIALNVQLGDTHLHGGDGSDGLYFYYSGSLFGENGNDFLASHSSFSDESLYGGANNDCIEDDNGVAAAIDCGSGSDRIYRTPSGIVPASLNCETITTSSCL